ncbi:glycosyltransferase family 39 protein [Streptomyces sp. NPDC050738]|uniref:glycosyltransferase family 39 protein n=1 Tax=Streptomyces sp. NPDC050738 TaxID=3154744 RepID=UPI003449D781
MARGAGLLRRAAPALIAYTSVRLAGLVLLFYWSHLKHHGLWPALATSWDSSWYLGIADHGYAHHLDNNNLAFFPLYPVLVKAVAAVTPGSRATVGVLLAMVCSLVAAAGIYAVGERLYGRRTGTVLAVLWGATPIALVQWMGYTESLFTALAAWSLYAVLTGRWVWAGLLAALAGLTRPTGVAVAAAVVVPALLALYRGNRSRRMVAGALIAPLGWLGYVAWVGVRVGRWDGYFAVQKLWKNQWDGGADTLREVRRQLIYQGHPQPFLLVVTACLALSAVLWLVCCVRDRQPLPLLVFTGMLLLVVLGSGGVYFPRARFLLPAFPLLLPFAVAIARARPRTLVLVLGGVALFSAYLGAYMTLVWTGPP